MKDLKEKQDKEFEEKAKHKARVLLEALFPDKEVELEIDHEVQVWVQSFLYNSLKKAKEETLQAVREEVEKLRKELPTHTNGEYCIDSQDGCEECYDTYYNEALNDLLKSLDI